MGFEGKKVAVIGAGVEGISSVKFLAKQKADTFLLDQKEKRELDKEKLGIAESLGATLVLGDTYLNFLDQFDFIFRSPVVRPDLPQLTEAAKKGSQITSQTKVFFDLCPATIIGVTGTKGKGTTSALITEILKKAGRQVFFGGNIGEAPLDFIDESGADSIVVLELSSFQLIDLQKSPHVAVILMVTSEHLDWHKNQEEYVNAKKNIGKYQTKKDFAIVNNDYPFSKEIDKASKAQKFYFSAKEKVKRGAFIQDDEIFLTNGDDIGSVKTNNAKILGKHNLQNIAAAAVATSILEIDLNIIQNTVNEFTGLPHRLEFISQKDGIDFYSDSASTIPETAVAAINSFRSPKVLILGGSSKNSDFSLLGKEIIDGNVKSTILIGQEANKIKDSIKKVGGFSGQIIEGLKSMDEIVRKAKNLSKPGDVVILSPACASFDMFKSYSDRGDQFKEAVKAL